MIHALLKGAAGGSPLKRPSPGRFLPGSSSAAPSSAETAVATPANLDSDADSDPATEPSPSNNNSDNDDDDACSRARKTFSASQAFSNNDENHRRGAAAAASAGNDSPKNDVARQLTLEGAKEEAVVHLAVSADDNNRMSHLQKSASNNGGAPVPLGQNSGALAAASGPSEVGKQFARRVEKEAALILKIQENTRRVRAETARSRQEFDARRAELDKLLASCPPSSVYIEPIDVPIGPSSGDLKQDRRAYLQSVLDICCPSSEESPRALRTRPHGAGSFEDDL